MATRKDHKGFLITFEGGEGTGKTTQIKALASWLADQGFRVEVTRQPGGTPIGTGIRRLLLDPKIGHVSPRAELLLYEADRAQHVDTFILPALRAGKVILSDRFDDSSTVYQGICRKLGRRWTQKLNSFATGGLSPDLVILLDLPVNVGQRRVKRRGTLDRIEREKAAFHNQVRRGFLSLARQFPKRIKVMDGTQTKEEIAHQIQRLVAKRFRIRTTP